MPSPPQPSLFPTSRWLEDELSSQGHTHIVGIDEAGRGPLAGPVVAAAALLPLDARIDALDDSKKLSEAQRDALFVEVHRHAMAIGVGVVCASEIDALNILGATKKAMKLALDALLRQLRGLPHLILVDGNQRFDHDHDIPMMPVVKGDQRCHNIAAASIVAKVTRDRLMTAYDELYPGYGFAIHKGYPTPAHKQQLEALGHCPLHRLSFRGVLHERVDIQEEHAHASEA